MSRTSFSKPTSKRDDAIRLGKKLKNDLIFLAAKGLFFLAAKIPLSVGLRLGSAIGRAAFFVLRPDRTKVLRHLKIAFPDSDLAWRKQTGADSFRYLGRSFFELFHFDEILTNEGAYHNYVVMEGEENLKKAAVSGGGGLVVTGHIGNWELMAAWAGHRGYILHPVIRKLYDERIDHLLNDHRRRYKYPPIARGGGPEGFEEIVSVLQRGEFLGILMDQDTKVRGTFAPFLGPLAHTPTGPAYLAYALDTDAMVAYTHRRRDGGTLSA
ncbi:MAG: hypothetical protein M5R36_01950 [Deltaproteobacteria bacterium]|nr:hypothetical protein [Deltaproteobacteria bacterium]